MSRGSAASQISEVLPLPSIKTKQQLDQAAAAVVAAAAATGVLVVEGQKLFPLGLSNPPPVGKQAPNGKGGPPGGQERRRQLHPHR